MQDYVRSGIAILNKTTKDVKDLNHLGTYLAKQTDINALKTLKLMILAKETGKLDKELDVNAISSHTYLIEESTGIEHKQKENIAGNLAMNPQYFSLELMEYISKNYPVKYNFQSFGRFSILETWLLSFGKMNYDEEDLFYKRYDMIDKKIDIIEFLIKNGLLSKRQVNNTLSTFQLLLDYEINFSNEQLQRIKYLVKDVNQASELHKRISYSKSLTSLEKDKKHEEIDQTTGIFRKANPDVFKLCQKNAFNELQRYSLQNDQCVYMINEIPRLIKK